MALEMVLRDRATDAFTLPTALKQYHPTPEGTSLKGLRALAHSVGLTWGMEYREERRAEFVAPSIVHLRSGHYSALLRIDCHRYPLRDPFLSGDVTREALVEERRSFGWCRSRMPSIS